MALKHKVPVKVQHVMDDMDRYISFQVSQGKPKPKRLALTMEQYRITKQHLGHSVYREMELYPMDV